MNSYALTLSVLGGVVFFCEGLFLILFRPHWRVLGIWWINIALYSQAISLLGLGLRTLIIYSNRLDEVSTLSGKDQTVSLLLALLAAFGSVVFITGYLLNRDWGSFRNPERKKRNRRRGDE